MVAATGGPLENRLDKSLAVRWCCHRWVTGGPPESMLSGALNTFDKGEGRQSVQFWVTSNSRVSTQKFVNLCQNSWEVTGIPFSRKPYYTTYYTSENC